VPEQVTGEHAPKLDRLFDDSERAVVTVKRSLGLPADASLAVVVEPAPGLQAIPPSGDHDDPPPPTGPAALTTAEPGEKLQALFGADVDATTVPGVEPWSPVVTGPGATLMGAATGSP
jgi:hypothetical protein